MANPALQATSKGGESTSSWSHTSAGGAEGVVVAIVDSNDATDRVTGVTYGGTSMNEVTGSPFFGTAGSSKVIYLYFLGAGVPSGASETVAITTSQTDDDWCGYCATYTADGDLEIHDTATRDYDPPTNNEEISTTLGLGGNICAVGCAISSDTPSLAWSALTGWTISQSLDTAVDTQGLLTYDTVASSDVTVGFQNPAGGDKSGFVVGYAIKDAASGGSDTIVAGQGSFTVTGQNVGLTRQLLLAAARGDFILSGQAVELRNDRVLIAESGNFAVTGQSVTLTKSSAGPSATIEQSESNGGTGPTLLPVTITAPGSNKILIACYSSTDALLSDPPTDNGTGSGTWTEVHFGSQSFSLGDLGMGIWWKPADGDETQVSADGLGQPADAAVFTVLVVSGLTATPFDKLIQGDGTGTTLTLTLAAATSQDDSLLTFFLAYRDDDADGTESWNGSMVTEEYAEYDGAVGDFDTALWTGIESMNTSAAHSRNWSTSGNSEEIYGVLLAWNVTDTNTLSVGHGAFTLTGQDVGLLADRDIALAFGSFALSGQVVDLRQSHVLVAEQGSYTLSGQVVDLKTGYGILIGSGTFTLTGYDIGLSAALGLSVGFAAFTLTGYSVTFTYAFPGWKETPGIVGDWTAEAAASVTWTEEAALTDGWTEEDAV